jgi:hypothetical protein
MFLYMAGGEVSQLEYDTVMEDTLTNKQHNTYNVHYAVPCFSLILKYISSVCHPLERHD